AASAASAPTLTQSDTSAPGATTRTKNVLVLYNNDFDDILPTLGPLGRDKSEVSRSAYQILDAVAAAGYGADLLGMSGRDLPEALGEIQRRAPDLVFNLTESLAQESNNEIVMPAVLDMYGIPFTGSGSLALGLCLHKPKAKDILRGRGVPTPASCTIERARDAAAVDLPYPLFVKLAREDASVGIIDANVVWSRRALVKRVRELIDEFQQPVLVERYIEGREVYVTLLGNEKVTTLPFHEIDFSSLPSGRPHIVGYAAKWDEASPEYHGTKPVPMRGVSPALRASVERTAIAAFRALELRDYGRVDFRVAEDGTPYVIDVNPNCDISPDAGVARAALVAGMSYPQLIGRICEVAWERVQHACSKARAA
ncbi:MAG: ATP-grasp domain-containing protein, partial [Myxococcales bacterium]|nr:ATP-grasp domain-containing protein [Myxococcales bacterium]